MEDNDDNISAHVDDDHGEVEDSVEVDYDLYTEFLTWKKSRGVSPNECATTSLGSHTSRDAASSPSDRTQLPAVPATNRGRPLESAIMPPRELWAPPDPGKLKSRIAALADQLPPAQVAAVSELLLAELGGLAPLASELRHLREAHERLASGRSSVGRSSRPDYVWERKITDELAKHPKEHTFIPEFERESGLRRLPQVESQVERTVLTAEDKALTNRLKGIARFKVLESIPKQEKLWSDQLRITAFIYDIMLKFVNDSEFWKDAVTEAPQLQDLLDASRFAFYSATSNRRNLVLQRIRTIAAAADLPIDTQDKDPLHSQQFPPALTEDERSAMIQSAKRRKVMSEITGKQPSIRQQQKNLFGKGPSLGRGGPRLQASDRHPSLPGGRGSRFEIPPSSEPHHQFPTSRGQRGRGHEFRGRSQVRGWRGRGTGRGRPDLQ